jgi:hypothetical protein
VYFCTVEGARGRQTQRTQELDVPSTKMLAGDAIQLAVYGEGDAPARMRYAVSLIISCVVCKVAYRCTFCVQRKSKSTGRDIRRAFGFS